MKKVDCELYTYLKDLFEGMFSISNYEFVLKENTDLKSINKYFYYVSGEKVQFRAVNENADSIYSMCELVNTFVRCLCFLGLENTYVLLNDDKYLDVLSIVDIDASKGECSSECEIKCADKMLGYINKNDDAYELVVDYITLESIIDKDIIIHNKAPLEVLVNCETEDEYDDGFEIASMCRDTGYKTEIGFASTKKEHNALYEIYISKSLIEKFQVKLIDNTLKEEKIVKINDLIDILDTL